MVELQGIPVSPGVAIGPALVLDADGYRISRTLIAADKAGEEYARLRSAVDAVAKQIEAKRIEATRLETNKIEAKRTEAKCNEAT